MHATPLIATLVIAFILAFVLATLAQRLRISPIVGYLLAGIAVGPFTPGFVADQQAASELAEIGIVLLMFGVGLHFSIKELLAVRGFALPGALLNIAVMTSLGAGLGMWLGWATGASILFGLSVSVASTVVVLRALEERRLITTEHGRMAVGWLVVEDAAMVLALVAVPVFAGINFGSAAAMADIVRALGLTLAKAAAFVALMLIGGRRLIPMILHYAAHSGSRELFRLAVLAISLGTAFGAAAVFGVSFATGAFFAGLVLAESTLSQQAARETLPLRDAFSVLFFVSVGMLFDPTIIVRAPLPVAATVLLILVAKPLSVFAITRLLKASAAISSFFAAAFAQIGEFSFILAGVAGALGLLPAEARDLILAGSIISILANPLAYALLTKWDAQRTKAQIGPTLAPAAEPARHAVLAGFGRVGRVIYDGLKRQRIPATIIDLGEVEGLPPTAAVVRGNAASSDVLALADLPHTEWLFVAVPDGFEAGQIVQQARAINPKLKIVARAHMEEEAQHLRRLGADRVIFGEEELGRGMIAAAFGRA